MGEVSPVVTSVKEQVFRELKDLSDRLLTAERQLADLRLEHAALQRTMPELEDYVARLAARVLKRVERADKTAQDGPGTTAAAQQGVAPPPPVDEITRRVLEARKRGVPNAATG